jgi:hypothetical protein
MPMLMLELVAMLTVTEGLVEDVLVSNEVAFVRRGDAVAPDPFDVAEALSLLRLSLHPGTV